MAHKCVDCGLIGFLLRRNLHAVQQIGVGDYRHDLLLHRDGLNTLQEFIRRTPENECTCIRVEHIKIAHRYRRSWTGRSSMSTMKSSLARTFDARKSLQSLGRGDRITSSPTLRMKTCFIPSGNRYSSGMVTTW